MVLYCAKQLLGLKKNQKPFLHLSLSKAGPFILGNHICIKALKCMVFQIIRCLIKPLLKNSSQTIFQGGTPWVAQLLNNVNVWMVLYCAQQLLGLKKNQKPFLHLSLSKAGPFTLESNMCDKALKSKVFQIIRCLIKPLLKTAPRQFFKVVPHEWLSYSIIWMFGWYSIVPNNFWGWKKIKTLESKLISIKSKLKSIKSKLKSIKSKLISIESQTLNWNQLKVNWNQLKVNWFQLKVNWNQLKVNWNQFKVKWNQLKVNWFQLKVNWNQFKQKMLTKIVLGGAKKFSIIQ